MARHLTIFDQEFHQIMLARGYTPVPIPTFFDYPVPGNSWICPKPHRDHMTLDRIRQGYILKPCEDCHVEDDMNHLDGGRQNIEEEEAARSGPIPESETSNARVEPSTPTGEPKHLMSMHGLQTHPNTIDDASRPSPSAYEFHVYYELAPSPASRSDSTEANSMNVDVSNHDMPSTPKSRPTSGIHPAGS